MTKADIVICNLRKVKAIADLLANQQHGAQLHDDTLSVIGEVVRDYTMPVLAAFEEAT